MKKKSALSLSEKHSNLFRRVSSSCFARLRSEWVVLLILFVLSIPLTLQTFQPGFFVGDDGEWMIIRSSAFHEAFRDGQIPVRFLGRLNHEFGYPVATFLYPGYLYLTEPLVILGLGFIDAIKIMFTLTMVLSGIFSYLWLSKLFNKWSALIGSLVYLYTPYHLVDMYNRGSLGELLALAVAPFILWQIERRSLFFSAVGTAGLILSHNILAAVFLPVLVIYALLRNTGNIQKKVFSVLVLMLLGLGLSAFFWIPALYELQYTIFNRTKISEWQNYFASFSQIGGLPLTLLAVSAAVIIFQKQFKTEKSFLWIKNYKNLFILFTLIGFVSIFFSTAYSTFLWNILPVSFIQFPFRFLSLEIIAAAFLSAYLMNALQQRIVKIIFASIVVIALAINALPYFTNITSFDKGEGFYTTNQSTTTTRDEYMPIWVKEKPFERAAEKVQIIKGSGEITGSTVTNTKISFGVNAKNDAEIQINKIYWPGWNASVDGRDAFVNYNNPKGVMTVLVPQGNHEVRLSFQETPLRLTADIISILSFVTLLAIVIIHKKTNVKHIRK